MKMHEGVAYILYLFGLWIMMAVSDEIPCSKRPRTTSIPQLQNGYDCIFVDEPPKHLQIECSICLCILHDPQVIDCECGLSYCLSCIKPIYEGRRPCPLCNCSFPNLMSNRTLKRTLNGLKVYCSFVENGCEWIGELGQLQDHLNDSPEDSVSKLLGCRFVQVYCAYCENVFERQCIQEHERNECLKRPFCCTHCREYESTFENVTKSHIPVCPSRPVPCPNECGEVPLCKDLDKHLIDSCPLQMIDCYFSYAGCEAMILRRDMEAHISENIVTHMCLQGASHQQQLLKLKSQVLKLQKENDKLKRKVESLVNDQKSMELQSQIVPIYLIMKRFSSRKHNNRQWVSPPFYTHLNGYRICLIVDLNGARGAHVSVFTELMRGPFDNELRWPFRGAITVELFNQEGEIENHSCIIDYVEAPIEYSRRVTDTRENNKSWGIERFISNNHLSPKFLKNDTLHFRISHVDYIDSD